MQIVIEFSLQYALQKNDNHTNTYSCVLYLFIVNYICIKAGNIKNLLLGSLHLIHESQGRHVRGYSMH